MVASNSFRAIQMAISLLGYGFLLLICVLWPVRSYRALRKHPIGQPITVLKPKRYAVGLAFTLGKTGLALWTGIDNHLSLFGSLRISSLDILAIIVFLSVTLGTLPLQVKYRSAGWRMRFYSILPATTGERALWVFICIIVAVGEELAYRSVAWGLCYRLTGSYWISAVIISIAFALNHLVQGWGSAGTIFVIGLGLHLLVKLSGGLFTAIAAHFFYDLLAGLIFGRVAEREFGKIEQARDAATAS
jgi:membrane protease YdiL (CAAX protease family)